MGRQPQSRIGVSFVPKGPYQLGPYQKYVKQMCILSVIARKQLIPTNRTLDKILWERI